MITSVGAQNNDDYLSNHQLHEYYLKERNFPVELALTKLPRVKTAAYPL